MRRVTMIVLAALALSGCAIPDLIAHTVKQMERTDREWEAKQAARGQPIPPAAAPADTSREEAPPPVSAPMSRPGGVTVQELPPG